MSKPRVVVASAVAAAFSFAVAAVAQGGPAPMPKYEHEKCYGIAKAGKNDCQTKMSACASTAKQSAQGDAWVYVPKGTCEKIVNGSMQPKA